MSVFVLLCIAVATFTGLMIVLIYADTFRSEAPGLLGIGGALVLIVLGLTALVIYPSRAVGRIKCRNFAAATGYPTRFRVLSWNDTGTCLAQAPDGHWTLNTHIIINVPAKGR